MKPWQAVCLALLVACAPSLDWRDVRLDGATVQMPCKPEHLQRDARVGPELFKVRMHVCDAAGISWAVLEVDARDAALAAAARTDLQRSLIANLDAAGESAATTPADPAAPAAASGAAQPWQWLRGRRADGAAVVAGVSYAVDGARVLQRVALLPREAGTSELAGLEMFHAAVNWAPR